MGQKSNPIINRMILNKAWQSRWFAAGPEYAEKIAEDDQIRKIIFKEAGPQALISRIEIDRSISDLKISIFTARPGVLIGRGGKGLMLLRERIAKKIKSKFKLDVLEVKKAELDAQIMADTIGIQISKRLPYRRAVKQTVSKIMDAGAKGVKISISGRLGGAEIARREKFSNGSVPLSTLRKNIDFAVCHARTTYGVIGIKVWINQGNKQEGE